MPDPAIKRPRKARFKVGDVVMANQKADPAYRNRRGIVTAVDLQTMECCRVVFSDGVQPARAYLRCSCLEL